MHLRLLLVLLAGSLISSLQAAGLVPMLGQPQQFPVQTHAGAGSAQYFCFNPALSMAQQYGGGTRNLGCGPRRVSQFFLEILVWETLTLCLSGRVHGEVEDSVATFVKECVAKPASNQQRKKWLVPFPLPGLQEVTPSKLDVTMRLLIPKGVASHDFWLKKMQALSMDAAGPLIHDLQLEATGSVVDPEMSQAVKHSLSLMGNFFARLTKERRRKVLLGLHKDLAHMANEDIAEAKGVLFGEGAADRIQKRSDVLKSLRKAKQPFRKGGAQGKGQLGHREGAGQLRNCLGNRPWFQKQRPTP